MWLACAMVLAGSATRAATIYKWVDENGVVHYSDQPHQNAQKVDVPAVQTYRPDSTYAPSGGPNAAMRCGGCLKRSASEGKLSYRVETTRIGQKRIFADPWTWRTGKTPCPGSCVPV